MKLFDERQSLDKIKQFENKETDTKCARIPTEKKGRGK